MVQHEKQGRKQTLRKGILQVVLVEPNVNDNLTCYVDRMRRRLKEGGPLFWDCGG